MLYYLCEKCYICHWKFVCFFCTTKVIIFTSQIKLPPFFELFWTLLDNDIKEREAWT